MGERERRGGGAKFSNFVNVGRRCHVRKDERESDKKPMDSTSVNSSETRREVKIMNGCSPDRMSARRSRNVNTNDSLKYTVLVQWKSM